MGISLFEYNQTAYTSAAAMLAQRGKAAVIHPTGTGKSFIAFKLCEEHPDKRMCWLAPSEYIFLTQAENLKKTGAELPENILFYTYARLSMMSGEELREIRPDYIILDEFHRAGAEVWGRAVCSLLALFPEVPLLGLSATNIRYLDNQRDMAEELFGGNIASEISLSEAIVRGILTPPKYVLSVFRYQGQLEQYEARIAKAKTRAVRDKAQAVLEELRRALEMSDGLDEVFRRHMENRSGKYLVFCANVRHMKEMLSMAPEWFAKVDKAPHIYSVTSDDPETSREFAAFKADSSAHLKLLFCIDMLNEGIHVDGIDGVILLRPTVSPIIYKQQIGRALSAGADKRTVIFDIVLNIENLCSIDSIREEMDEIAAYYCEHGMSDCVVNDRFEVIDEVRDCIRLFDRLNDTLSASWELMFASAKKYYEENGDLRVPKGYLTEDGYHLGCWIRTQRNNYFNDPEALPQWRVELLESIGMCWQVYDSRWNESFAAVKAYYLKNGSLDGIKKADKSSSDWLTKQRQKYRQGLLTAEQTEKLNSVGIVWETDGAWNACFEAAKEYYREYGDLDIPAACVTPEGLKLGAWYRSVRTAYKKGVLSEERRKKLEEIGISWVSVKERTWLSYYEKAKEYCREHGNADIPADYLCSDGKKLGTWVSSQRYAYAKNTLPENYITLLEELGFSWQRFDSKWENGYRYAQAYYAEHRNIDAPVSHICPEGYALGRWLNRQRISRNQGKLSEERIARLDQLGMRWTSAGSTLRRIV